MLDMLAGGTATVRAGVTIDHFPLRPDIEPKLVRTVVDTHLHLPDMFELTFLDEECTLASTAGFSIGSVVEITGGAATSAEAQPLITGEITSIEAVCAQLHVYTVVRGYEKAHRLQRAPRTRTFLNATDSSVAEQVANDAGIEVGTIDSTRTTHEHLSQVAQTDWEFLKSRAREIGYETGVAGGKFFFRKASGTPAGGGGMLDAAAGAAASLAGMGPSTLTFKDNLLEFHPRLTAANLTPKVEVRVWDPGKAEVVSGKADIATFSATIEGQDPKVLATQFNNGLKLPIPKPPVPIPGMPNFGQGPDATAYVVATRPLAEGTNATAAADEMAAGVAEHIASTFAEAEGYAVGDPGVQAGAKVTVAGVPSHFAGTWVVTNAKHTFDESEGGYHVRFWVSGRHERSLLGLSSLGQTQGERVTIPGVVCGVVTNVADETNKGRVKVALPWLAPNYETGWARVAQFGAGTASGSMFLPDVGDEVLVGFEHGDPRRPFVLGGLVNDNSEFEIGGEATKTTGMAAGVVRRGISTPTKNGLVFHDELMPAPPQGGGTPTTSEILLGSLDKKVAVSIDKVGATLVISCDIGAASRASGGTIRIETGAAGTVEVKAGAAGSVSVESGGTLALKGQQGVTIESSGMVEIKGAQIKLN